MIYERSLSQSKFPTSKNWPRVAAAANIMYNGQRINKNEGLDFETEEGANATTNKARERFLRLGKGRAILGGVEIHPASLAERYNAHL